MSLSIENRKVLLLLFFALLIRLFLVFPGLQFLLKNSIVYDDAFIAFSIARNVYLGNGFSFNGLEPTAGSPIVWPLLISAFGFLGKEALALFGVTLGGVFFVLSGIPLYSISQKIFNEKNLSLMILALFLFNPFFILMSLNGLESPLFVFFLLLTFWYYLKYIRDNHLSLFKIFFLGILFLLSILTREEGYLIFLSIFLDQFLFFKRRFRTIVIFAIFLATLVLPQIIYRLYFFGNIVSSNFYFFLKTPWSYKHGFLLQRTGVLILIFSLINTALGNILLSLSGFFFIKTKNILKLFPLITYAFFNILFYSFVIPVGTFRYTFPVSGILTIGLGIFFIFLKERLKLTFKGIVYKSIFAVFLVLFLGLLSLSSFMIWTNVRYGGDGEVMWKSRNINYYNAAKFINVNTPENTIVASVHTGTLQYSIDKRYVIDAGGKVDYKVVDYTNQNKLFDYLKSKNVSYMVQIVSPEQIKAINESDITYIETIYLKPNEPLAYIRGIQTHQIENYLVILKFTKEYTKFFLPVE